MIPAGVALEADPDVYDAVKSLALRTIEAAVDILDTAAPQQQLQMIRIMLPRLTSSLRTAPEDDKGELRDGMTAIYDMVRDALEPPDSDPAEAEA